jgi:hypothetical protein
LFDPPWLSLDFTGATAAEIAIAAVIVNAQKILLLIIGFLLRLNDCENRPAGRRQPAGDLLCAATCAERGVTAVEILVLADWQGRPDCSGYHLVLK